MTLLLQKGKSFEKPAVAADAGDHTEMALQRSVERLTLAEERGSSETFTKSRTPRESQVSSSRLQDLLRSSMSCELVQDMSHLDTNVDQWMLGTSTETGVQGRVPMVQRSTLTPGLGSFFNMARVWCVLALVMPLFTFHGHWGLRCTPSLLFNSAEFMLANMATMVERARAQVTRLARQEITRDCFATTMDVVLVVYACGFLVLSMYQAAIIG